MGLLVLACAACLSPTLPLPPPEPPRTQLSADRTTVTLDGGGAIPGAFVTVFNVELGRGVVVTGTPQNTYHAVLDVDLNNFLRNELQIWQRYGKDDSTYISVLITPP